MTRTRTEVVDPGPVPGAGGGGGSYEGASGGRQGPVGQEQGEVCAGLPAAERPYCVVGRYGLPGPGGRGGEPGGAGRAAGPVVVTSTDVARVMARGSGVVRQPPGAEALVSRIVIVYTSSASQELSTRVGDQDVSVLATPVSSPGGGATGPRPPPPTPGPPTPTTPSTTGTPARPGG